MKDNQRDLIIFTLFVAFIILLFIANGLDNCRDAFMDGANVKWQYGFSACNVEVDIDGETKQITPMQWYRLVENDK